MVIFSYFLLLFFLYLPSLHGLEPTSDDRSIEQHLKQSKKNAPDPSSLEISGVLQSDWSHLYTDQKKPKGGSGSQRPLQRANRFDYRSFGINEFSVQLDLMIDFKNENSSSSVQLEFEDPAGIKDNPRNRKKKSTKNMLAGSGEGDFLYVVKAYMNYSLINKNGQTLLVEFGRRYMSDLFDSIIQFNSEFDGVTLQYSHFTNSLGTIACNAGAFVVDYRSNHFGYIGQLDLYNIHNINLDFNYSLTCWDKKGANAYGKRNALGNRFINSQIGLAYHLPHSIRAYGAFLHNHAATKNWRTNGTKQANGGYFGATYGQIVKKNDFSIDCNYQWVQAQAIPESDIAGIGRYNPTGISFYSNTSGGYANYKGFVTTCIYALTDQLNLQLLFQKARPTTARIGGKWNAWTLELTTIYNF